MNIFFFNFEIYRTRKWKVLKYLFILAEEDNLPNKRKREQKSFLSNRLFVVHVSQDIIN